MKVNNIKSADTTEIIEVGFKSLNRNFESVYSRAKLSKVVKKSFELFSDYVQSFSSTQVSKAVKDLTSYYSVLGALGVDFLRAGSDLLAWYNRPEKNSLDQFTKDFLGEYMGDIAGAAMVFGFGAWYLPWVIFASSNFYNYYTLERAQSYFAEKSPNKVADRALAGKRGYEGDDQEIYVRQKGNYHTLKRYKAISSMATAWLGFCVTMRGSTLLTKMLSQRNIGWAVNHFPSAKFYTSLVSAILNLSAQLYKSLSYASLDAIYIREIVPEKVSAQLS